MNHPMAQDMAMCFWDEKPEKPVDLGVFSIVFRYQTMTTHTDRLILPQVAIVQDRGLLQAQYSHDLMEIHPSCAWEAPHLIDGYP